MVPCDFRCLWLWFIFLLLLPLLPPLPLLPFLPVPYSLFPIPRSPLALIQPPINRCYRFNPLRSLPVFHVHERLMGPMEVIRQVGYLLAQPIERVA